MKYRKGYKYQLAATEVFHTGFDVAEPVHTEFIDMDIDGVMTVRAGYAWDGASGPTVDTKNTMRASLAHDALYQLIRNGHLPAHCRLEADEFMYKCLIQDGMWKVRAWLWRRELNRFAGFAASPKNVKKVYEAP